MSEQPEPETLEDLCDYILQHAGDIYVRAEVNGRWGSYALTEMPAALAIEHALGFIKRGVIPLRMLRDFQR